VLPSRGSGDCRCIDRSCSASWQASASPHVRCRPQVFSRRWSQCPSCGEPEVNPSSERSSGAGGADGGEDVSSGAADSSEDGAGSEGCLPNEEFGTATPERMVIVVPSCRRWTPSHSGRPCPTPSIITARLVAGSITIGWPLFNRVSQPVEVTAGATQSRTSPSGSKARSGQRRRRGFARTNHASTVDNRYMGTKCVPAVSARDLCRVGYRRFPLRKNSRTPY
jgi:hypothetical protein